MSGGGSNDDPWRKTPDPRPPGDIGPPPPPGDPCIISEITMLNSPNRTVLATLIAGNTLDLEYIPGPPRRLVAKTASNAVAGSITSISLPQLIQCIQGGRHYVAEIISLSGAVCQVRVRNQ